MCTRMQVRKLLHLRLRRLKKPRTGYLGYPRGIERSQRWKSFGGLRSLDFVRLERKVMWTCYFWGNGHILYLGLVKMYRQWFCIFGCPSWPLCVQPRCLNPDLILISGTCWGERSWRRTDSIENRKRAQVSCKQFLGFQYFTYYAHINIYIYTRISRHMFQSNECACWWLMMVDWLSLCAWWLG